MEPETASQGPALLTHVADSTAKSLPSSWQAFVRWKGKEFCFWTFAAVSLFMQRGKGEAVMPLRHFLPALSQTVTLSLNSPAVQSSQSNKKKWFLKFRVLKQYIVNKSLSSCLFISLYSENSILLSQIPCYGMQKPSVLLLYKDCCG